MHFEACSKAAGFHVGCLVSLPFKPSCGKSGLPSDISSAGMNSSYKRAASLKQGYQATPTICAVIVLWLGGCATLPDVRTIGTTDGETSYATAGDGRPVVVLESGMGPTMATWSPIFDDLAQFATVFAYDRPGYGRSSSSQPPRSASDIAKKLHALLAQAHHEPPYVLVGHSAGGLYINAFARLFPNDIAGLVFVDATHPDWSDYLRQDHPFIYSTLITSTTIGHFGMRRYEAEVISSTRKDFDNLPDFPNVPVVILTSEKSSLLSTRAMQAKWSAFQRDLASLSLNATHTVVAGSGHYIHQDRPEVVIEAVKSIVDGARQ